MKACTDFLVGPKVCRASSPSHHSFPFVFLLTWSPAKHLFCLTCRSCKHSVDWKGGGGWRGLLRMLCPVRELFTWSSHTCKKHLVCMYSNTAQAFRHSSGVVLRSSGWHLPQTGAWRQEAGATCSCCAQIICYNSHSDRPTLTEKTQCLRQSRGCCHLLRNCLSYKEQKLFYIFFFSTSSSHMNRVDVRVEHMMLGLILAVYSSPAAGGQHVHPHCQIWGRASLSNWHLILVMCHSTRPEEATHACACSSVCASVHFVFMRLFAWDKNLGRKNMLTTGMRAGCTSYF